MLLATRHAMAPRTFYRDKVVLHEGQETQYFYIVRSGEVELSKKVRKGHANKAPPEPYIAHEKMRVTDANHNIARYDDDNLEKENHCVEGDDTGIVGGTVNWNTG